LLSQELQNMAYYQAGEAFDSIVDGDDLEQVALLGKRKIMTTDFFTQDGNGLSFEERAGFAKAAFGLPNDEISEVQQLGNSYYLIKVIETIEPGTQPLEIVKESIVLTLTAKLQKEAANEAAQALMKKAESTETIEQLAKENNMSVVSTGLFTQSQAIDGIGQAPEFAKAAFGLGKENLIHNGVLEVGQDFYIIGFKEKVLPEETKIAQTLGELKKQVAYMKQGQYFQSWIEALKTSAKIDINSKFLN